MVSEIFARLRAALIVTGPRPGRSHLTTLGKVVVVAYSAWALAVILPDCTRVFVPLSTIGLTANNNGVITSVALPAAAWGLEPGDRIDIANMSCAQARMWCHDTLSIFGGMGGLQYVSADDVVVLEVLPGPGHSLPMYDPTQKRYVVWITPITARDPTTAASIVHSFALALDEAAGILFIVAAAALVWLRPCAMTFGFFLYAMWYNPGQYFEFYAWLNHWPFWEFTQETLQALAQAAGYVGFLVLVMRFPNNVLRPRWRVVQMLLPVVFIVMSALQLAVFLNSFGIGTERISDAFYILGWVIDAVAALLILPMVLHDQTPAERQRTRWLLYGCIIGLAAFIVADANEATSLWPFTPLSESQDDFLYFLNVTTLFGVWYAIRHHRVVDVRFAAARALERLAIWVGIVAMGAVLIHEADKTLDDPRLDILRRITRQDVPFLNETLVALILIVITLFWEQIEERLIEFSDRFFFPTFYRALHTLETLCAQLVRVRSVVHIDRSLVETPASSLRLAGAALFRRDRNGVFRRRCETASWTESDLYELDAGSDLLRRLEREDDALRIGDHRWTSHTLPSDEALPTVAVPVHAFGSLYAVVLYGSHDAGDILNREEIVSLEALARSAALAYEAVEAAALRRLLGFVRTARSPQT